ncbi:MAG: aminotransferase class I/II-fold pyridoxal phosphate-dependent enzyme [Candidatus Latescibacterota bacterium]|nr:aminotransferase class I/II-fold pyridoxal phosphate-dependent enzyme [Candidatus Latescibacterota bacterium]
MSLPLTCIVKSLPPVVPFVGPEALERRNGRPFQVRVGANESPFGVSPTAAESMRRAVGELWMYNDPEAHDLTARLADEHGVRYGEISVGAGIDDLLGVLVRIFAEPGAPIVTSLGSYPTFNYHVAGYGACLEEVPYVDDHANPVALVERVCRCAAPLIYLANPDNPMGTWLPAQVVGEILDGLPEQTVLILDEAYVDFAPPEAIPEIVTDDLRLIRARTFSKAHGMAGARIGYLIAHAEVVSAIDRVRNQFGVNRVAQAGALASLDDGEHMRHVVGEVESGRTELVALAEELGLNHVDSATNFVNIDMGSGDRARATLAGLLERDVFVRMPTRPPGDRCIRVTVGISDQRRLFAEALRSVVAEQGY